MEATTQSMDKMSVKDTPYQAKPAGPAGTSPVLFLKKGHES